LSCFAGSGIGARFYEALSRVWVGLYGMEIKFTDVTMCEKHPLKQRFLKSQHDFSILVENSKELAADMVTNKLDESGPYGFGPFHSHPYGHRPRRIGTPASTTVGSGTPPDGFWQP